MAMPNALPMDYAPPVRNTVERRQNLSFQEFVNEYLFPNRPVILTDAAAGWRALSRWSASFFAQEFRDREVVMAQGKKYFKTTMGDFIQYAGIFADVNRGKKVENKPYYLRNVIISQNFPELLNDFKVHEFFLPNWLERWPLKHLFPLAASSSSELFVGPQGASVPVIHRDRFMTHSWLTQINGRKAFWAVSPEENGLMYQDPADPDHSMVNDIVDPDLTRFPLFAKARVLGTVLMPGETVFIPAGWWHTAECLDLSISISGNFVNSSNFSRFREMTTLSAFAGAGRAKRIMNRAVLKAHGFLYGVMDINYRRRAAS